MTELILTAIGAAIVNNVVLSQFLGLCPFLGVSKKIETAAGMGAAVIFVITIASAVASLIQNFVLIPLHLEFLQTIREEHKDDDDVLIALGEIESELNAKKYGLVWEQHEEAVDLQMRANIPVFT